MTRAFHITQPSRSVLGRNGGMSAESLREVPVVAALCFWVTTLLTSWVLVGLVVAGIWWVVT